MFRKMLTRLKMNFELKNGVSAISIFIDSTKLILLLLLIGAST